MQKSLYTKTLSQLFKREKKKRKQLEYSMIEKMVKYFMVTFANKPLE